MSRRPFPEAALVALLVLGPSMARAAGTPATSGGARPELPTPPPGEGRQAKELIDALTTKNPALARRLRRPLLRARHALERAAGARAAGDAARARLLEGLALEWAETARDFQRAAEVEAEASAEGRRALALAERVERARALLAETQARRGQVALELERAGAGSGPGLGAAPANPGSSEKAPKKPGPKKPEKSPKRGKP